MKQYILWRWSEFVLFVVVSFFGKKEERMLKQKHDISNGLFRATGIYQKCLSNIHTEFLANDSKFLSLIKVSHHFKD